MRRLPAAMALLVLAAGCGSDAPSNPPPSNVGGCITSADGSLRTYRADGLWAEIAVLGKGSSGVVVSYEMDGTVCSWLPLADQLTASGYRVLLYDRIEGDDAAAFVAPMVATLRDDGATQVALVGGSIGGMASVTEAATVQPPVRAVVSLSGASSDTIAAAGALRMPLLQIVARDDEPFASQAKYTDDNAARSPGHRLIVESGNAHASLLFATDKTVVPRIDAFLQAAMPPR